MHVLIFEPVSSGHRREWINHLLNYIRSTGDPTHYTLITGSLTPSPATVGSAGEGVGGEAYRGTGVESEAYRGTEAGCEMLQVPSSIQHKLSTQNHLLRTFTYYRLARDYCIRHQPDHFLFLMLNDVQWLIGLNGFPCPVSGILFKPFIRMRAKTIGERLIRFRKRVQTWLLVRRKTVTRIFVLNDTFAAQELNRIYRTSKFGMLPDPVARWTAEPGYDIRMEFGIDRDAKILLHTGSFSSRKGTLEIMDAMVQLRREKVALLLLGKPHEGFEKIIADKLSKVQRACQGILVFYKPGFVPEGILQAALEQCDAVLAPYHYPESSSSLVGHAIANNKPVLVPEGGLTAEMVKQYGAGIFIKKITPEVIARGIVSLLYTEKPENRILSATQGSAGYIAAHTPEAFISQLLRT